MYEQDTPSVGKVPFRPGMVITIEPGECACRPCRIGHSNAAPSRLRCCFFDCRSLYSTTRNKCTRAISRHWHSHRGRRHDHWARAASADVSGSKGNQRRFKAMCPQCSFCYQLSVIRKSIIVGCKQPSLLQLKISCSWHDILTTINLGHGEKRG